MNPLIQLKKLTPLFLGLFVLVCLTLSPRSLAVSPAPDGGYHGGNTAEGTDALFSLTSGVWNTALGYRALYRVTTGTQNTATGYQTLFSNTTGSLSTAYGSQSLYHNTTGSFNTATGFRTLYANTTGSNNTGNGYEALAFNTTGFDNAANGFEALYSNTTGTDNTAVGSQALVNNTIGQSNTAVGFRALAGSVLWNGNTAVGDSAMSGSAGTGNTAIGGVALAASAGDNNIALGVNAGHGLITGDNNIYIGNFGAPESNTIRIGDVQTTTFIAGISAAPVPFGVPVYVNTSGQLGTAPSSARFKEDIKPMAGVSEKLYALQPVTFHYKNEFDPGAMPQFGLVAEEVEKVNPDLIVRDKDGKPYSVRYDAVNAMLLNEFLKAHRKMEEQEVTITQLKSGIEKQEAANVRQQKQIEALAAGLQKVTAQLEVDRHTRSVVATHP